MTILSIRIIFSIIIILIYFRKTRFSFILLVEFYFIIIFFFLKIFNFYVILTPLFLCLIISACRGLISFVKKIRFHGGDQFILIKK